MKKSLSRVWLFATPWTVQSSPGQNTGVVSLSPSPGDLPDSGGFFTNWAIREALYEWIDPGNYCSVVTTITSEKTPDNMCLLMCLYHLWSILAKKKKRKKPESNHIFRVATNLREMQWRETGKLVKWNYKGASNKTQPVGQTTQFLQQINCKEGREVDQGNIGRNLKE